jgi:hypothetical protein
MIFLSILMKLISNKIQINILILIEFNKLIINNIKIGRLILKTK